MIYFDLDMVIRDFVPTIWGGEEPLTWSQKVEGGSLYDYVRRNKEEVLLNSPETKYASVIKEAMKGKTITIVSSQPEDWREETTEWITKHLGEAEIHYTKDSDEKLKLLSPEDILIDDSPNFSNFEQVALVRYPYNTIVLEKHKPFAVISSVEDMKKLIQQYNK